MIADTMPQMPQSGSRLVCSALILLWIVLHCTALKAESTFSIAKGKTTTHLSFELIDNRVFVDVRLNGQGPFHFILDTGAGGFSISDQVASRLRLAGTDAGVAIGVGEKTEQWSKTHIGKAKIGDLQFEDIEAAVFPGSDSGSVFGTKPLDGIVGLEVFQRVVVKHDYIHDVLTFTTPNTFHYRGRGTVVHFDRTRYVPIVDAELDGVAGRFGIDTGARSSLLVYGPFAEKNHLKEKYGAKLEGVTGWGIGGPVRSLLARARQLSIGEVAVHDLVIRLSTQNKGLTTSSEMAGLIGPDVLSQFDMTVDYSRNQLIFEKNRNYGRHDSYDRCGMWLGQEEKHFTVVDVIVGGPAAQAGIKRGESILAIDGVSTEKLVLPDVREKIRRDAIGKKLAFTLESNGKQRTVLVTLRDLV